jgi:hypothetical protein
MLRHVPQPSSPSNLPRRPLHPNGAPAPASLSQGSYSSLTCSCIQVPWALAALTGEYSMQLKFEAAKQVCMRHTTRVPAGS